MKHIILYAGFALALALPTACSQDDGTDGAAPAPTDARHTPMTFAVTHPAQTRATDAGFDEGDSIGLFVAAEDAPLEIGGNLVNNEPLRLTAGTWAANRTLYWDEGTYNAYAYYPYTRPVSSRGQRPALCPHHRRERKQLAHTAHVPPHNEQADHPPRKGRGL